MLATVKKIVEMRHDALIVQQHDGILRWLMVVGRNLLIPGKIQNDLMAKAAQN